MKMINVYFRTKISLVKHSSHQRRKPFNVHLLFVQESSSLREKRKEKRKEHFIFTRVNDSTSDIEIFTSNSSLTSFFLLTLFHSVHPGISFFFLVALIVHKLGQWQHWFIFDKSISRFSFSSFDVRFFVIDYSYSSEFLSIMQANLQQKDTTYTKIFVGGKSIPVRWMIV